MTANYSWYTHIHPIGLGSGAHQNRISKLQKSRLPRIDGPVHSHNKGAKGNTQNRIILLYFQWDLGWHMLDFYFIIIIIIIIIFFKLQMLELIYKYNAFLPCNNSKCHLILSWSCNTRQGMWLARVNNQTSCPIYMLSNRNVTLGKVHTEEGNPNDVKRSNPQKVCIDSLIHPL